MAVNVLRRGDGQAAHTRNNPHVKCTAVYCAQTVNNADTNELCSVQFSVSWIPSLTLTLIVQFHTKLLVTVRDTCCRLQLEHKVASLALDPTHCSRDTRLA